MIFKNKIRESISTLFHVINKILRNREQRKWRQQNYQRNDIWKISGTESHKSLEQKEPEWWTTEKHKC